MSPVARSEALSAQPTSRAPGAPDDDDARNADQNGDDDEQQQGSRGAHRATIGSTGRSQQAAGFLIRFSNGDATLGGVNDERLTRRSILRLAGVAAASLGAGAWKASGAEGGGPTAVESGAVTCVLTPELTQGPFYIPNEKLRRNITDGHPGTTLILQLAVVDASTCKPIKGAAVDIWHADASGVYSGVAGNTGTFLRGVQKTDHTGLAVFDTIYPGWYRGRAVHIHVKVHLGGNVVHTGQLFLPDALSDQVYEAAPYKTRGNPDTPDGADAIYRNGGSRSLLHPVKSGSRFVGSMVMGVHRG
jgi:hypothetical protein